MLIIVVPANGGILVLVLVLALFPHKPPLFNTVNKVNKVNKVHSVHLAYPSTQTTPFPDWWSMREFLEGRCPEAVSKPRISTHQALNRGRDFRSRIAFASRTRETRLVPLRRE